MKRNLDCGIYKIKNLINGDFYIGQSINLHKREIDHFGKLRRKESRNTHLQNAFNKYGKENFIFKVLLYCEPDQLTYYEQKMVDILNPHYNIRKNCVDSPRGTIASAETRKKISDAGKGRILSDESRNKISIARKGMIFPKEHRENISKALTGRKMPEELRLRLSESKKGSKSYQFGTHLTDELKMRISLSGKGKHFKDRETIEKIRFLLDENIYSILKISKVVEVSRDTVYNVINGYYRDVYGI
jgi:group I intron endonuclease